MSDDRFVVRATGRNATAAAEVRAFLDAMPELQVVREMGAMMLVRGSASAAQKALGRVSGWTLFPSTKYSVPDTRPKLAARG